jgi:hypothetical protein
MIGGIDHHRALRLRALVLDDLAPPLGVDLLPVRQAIEKAVVLGDSGEIGQSSLAWLGRGGMGVAKPATGGGNRHAGHEVPAAY